MTSKTRGSVAIFRVPDAISCIGREDTQASVFCAKLRHAGADLAAIEEDALDSRDSAISVTCPTSRPARRIDGLRRIDLKSIEDPVRLFAVGSPDARVSAHAMA